MLPSLPSFQEPLQTKECRYTGAVYSAASATEAVPSGSSVAVGSQASIRESKSGGVPISNTLNGSPLNCRSFVDNSFSWEAKTTVVTNAARVCYLILFERNSLRKWPMPNPRAC